MTCSQTEKVSLLIDGELLSAEAAALELHLQQCAECHQAQEAFLSLRSQISDYHATLDPAAADLALAKILSRPTISEKPTLVPRSWRDRLSTAFGVPGLSVLSPRFAAAAAVVVLAFTIGGIALLRNRPQADVANKAVETSRPSAGTGDNISAPPDELAVSRKPRGPKAISSERQRPTPQTKNKGSVKPTPAKTPERNAPNQPRRRNEIAPNYSAFEDTVAENTWELAPAGAELLTARHMEQSELLLRAFRNVRAGKADRSPEIRYERRRAQQLLYQNILIRREADAAGDVQVATLLGSLEPILLDIANLRSKPRNEEVTAIKDRVERKSLVPLLQINSTAVARAYE